MQILFPFRNCVSIKGALFLNLLPQEEIREGVFMTQKEKRWDGAVDPDTKALSHGFECLTDSELLAIIIRTGGGGCNATDLASKVLALNKRQWLNLYDLDVGDLTQIPGIGKTKALQLKAVGEAARRLTTARRQSGIIFNDAASIADYYMEQMRHEPQEISMAAFFDAKGAFIGDKRISVGSLTGASVSPRDVFRHAIHANACFVTVLHNHPSGNPEPSRADDQVTRILLSSGMILNVPLLDHIIIGDNKFFSYYENGLLKDLGGS